MKKIGILVLTVFISIIFASVFGFLHNQISYTIAPEYFLKFKFQQFGFVEYGFNNPRLTTGLIGVLATWWFGLLIGLVHGIVGLFQRKAALMWKSIFGAIIRTLLVAVIFSFIGILVGVLIIQNLDVEWNLPANLEGINIFLIAGTMHNFSYLGGVIGLIYGIVFQVRLMKN